MKEYPKIQTIFKRDEKTHKVILDTFSLPEFEYLRHNIWIFTEKIDGTNIRVMWNGQEVSFGGKTDDTQIPPFLLVKLQEMFPAEKFQAAFGEKEVCLYGEGYGARIQKGGGRYIPDGVSFILIDVKIDQWWLKRDALENIVVTLGIEVVPIVGRGTIDDAIALILWTETFRWFAGLKSTFGDFLAEGLVLKPEVCLMTRRGDRVITKIKHRDF